jgi:hypothetical protein
VVSVPRGCLQPHLRAVQCRVGADDEVCQVPVQPPAQDQPHHDRAAYASGCVGGEVHPDVLRAEEDGLWEPRPTPGGELYLYAKLAQRVSSYFQVLASSL